MKRKSILLSVLLMSVVSVFAQKAPKADSPFIGIWQYCGARINLEASTQEVTYASVFKILQPDGKLYNMQFGPKGQAFFFVEGTWEQTSDNTYTEHVKTHLGTGIPNNKGYMTWKFSEDGKKAIATYKSTDGGSSTEIYCKVEAVRPGTNQDNIKISKQ